MYIGKREAKVATGTERKRLSRERKKLGLELFVLEVKPEWKQPILKLISKLKGEKN